MYEGKGKLVQVESQTVLAFETTNLRILLRETEFVYLFWCTIHIHTNIQFCGKIGE